LNSARKNPVSAIITIVFARCGERFLLTGQKVGGRHENYQ
jgi:hypothetical protein